MAKIRASADANVLKIKEFLGLNENPDGDTKIKNGELSECRNFRITQDKHLQIRPGQKTILELRPLWDEWAKTQSDAVKDPRLCGVWSGLVDGKRKTVAAFGGAIFRIEKFDGKETPPKIIGECTQDDTSFFGFGNKVYLLNGHEYMGWDGKDESEFKAVEGYIPTVITASTPEGNGVALEKVNRLTGKRKAKFSPDSSSRAYRLPDKEVDEVVKVEGTTISYTLDKANGIVNFSSPPASGTNTLAIIYRKGNGEREKVEKMHYAEFFNGTTDTRVFLYGDGTNKTIYSGNELDKGTPTAEYFPDLYETQVGSANSPITAMVRHYSRLLVFKQESAWSVSYNVVTDPLGAVTSAFYVSPVNRALGNVAPGQVILIENNPVSLCDGAAYQWKPSSIGVNDNRTASRITDRVTRTMRSFNLEKTRAFNRHRENELWFVDGDRALILNYAADAWYFYTGFPLVGMEEYEGQLYGFTSDGRVIHISRRHRCDDRKDIVCYAATGAMDFDKDWMLKYSPLVYVALQPESGGRVTVTVETNRRSDYREKIASAGLSNFDHVDFRHFSFGTNRKPQVRRIKMKVKKATFYKLIFKSASSSATATVLEADIQLRYAGKVK